MTNPTPTSGAADRCQACIDRNDGFYGSYAPKCPAHNDDGTPRDTALAKAQQPALTAQAISAEPAAHVQNPAENEHVAGDVSKNGAEVNMSTQQPAPAGAMLFDEQGFRDWVLRNLPNGSVIGNSEWWADHLTARAKRFVKSAPKPSPTPQAADTGATAEPYGWLYDWTHSSATGRPDTTYTGFTKYEAHARKHDNCIAVFTAPHPAPAAGAVAGQMDDIDAVALARYKVEPSHDSMFHRFAVVAGDGQQQIYVGRETECQNMARKFYGAFLDGAFYHSRATQPTQAQAGAVALTDNELVRLSRVGAIQTDDSGKVMLWPASYKTQMEDRFKSGWREAEKHHGITKEGGQP